MARIAAYARRLEGSHSARVQRLRRPDGSIAPFAMHCPTNRPVRTRQPRNRRLVQLARITLSTVNRLAGSAQAYYETTAIYRALGLGDGIDAQIIVANTNPGNARGHLTGGGTSSEEFRRTERALAGDSAAVGRRPELLRAGFLGHEPMKRQSACCAKPRDMAGRYTGPDSPVTIQARVFLGEALWRTARMAMPPACSSKLTMPRWRITASLILDVACRIAVGLLAMSDGNNQLAEQQLTRAVAGLRKLGAKAPPRDGDGARRLGLGRLRLKGAPRKPRLYWREAGVRFAKRRRMTSGNWRRRRSGWVRCSSKSGNAAAAAMLEKASTDLESQLAPIIRKQLRAKLRLAEFARDFKIRVDQR